MASLTTAPTLRRLGPEPWGWRLKRVREHDAGLSLDELAELIGHYMLTTASTISRLEALDEIPTGSRSASRRQLAYLIALALEIDPAEFGVGFDDLPPGITVPPRTPSNLRERSTIW